MKLKRKIGLILCIALLLTIVFSIRVEAASASISASSTSVEVGTTVTINVNITAASYNLYIDGDGISRTAFVDFSQDAVNENFTESVSFTPETAGTYTINLTGTVVDETQTEGDSVNKSVTITVREKETSENNSGSNNNSSSNNNSGSNNNSSSSNNNSSTSSTPSFTEVNETVYATGSLNVRRSWSTSSEVIGSLSEGQSVTRTGIGNNGWSRVTFNGSTAYIYSANLTTEKPEKEVSNLLKSLTVTPGTLTPEFEKNTMEYTINVNEDVTELEIDAVAEDENAEVTIEGNENFVLGENTVEITVTPEDGEASTYTIKVNKTEGETISLSKLEVNGYVITPTFNPEVYSYSVNVPTGTTSLDITAETDIEGATVEITGNNDLKDGENLITIIVKTDDENVTTYQLTANVGETAVATTEETSGFNVLTIICMIAAGVIIIAIIVLIVLHHRNNQYDDDDDDDELYYDEDYTNNYMNDFSNINSEKEDKKTEKEKMKEEKEKNKEEYLNHYQDMVENSNNDDDDEPKKPKKGRHF